MNFISALNTCALLLAITLAVIFSGAIQQLWHPKNEVISSSPNLQTLKDDTGVEVPVRSYKRIASGSMVADRLLIELANPDQILAFSGFTKNAPWAYRMGSKQHLESLQNIEQLLTLNPDLFVVHHSVSILELKQLRDSGIAMFDLGPYGGIENLLEDIRTLSSLLGHPERGEKLAHQLSQRMQNLKKQTSHILPKEKPTALYLSRYGKNLYGGTRGSSLHDVLEYAGLKDIAAEHYTGWPRFTAEQILKLNPDWIVTQTGMKKAICFTQGLQNLNACQQPNRVIEIQTDILTSPGPGMVDAAEILYQHIFENTTSQKANNTKNIHE